ncbi:MAG: Yip1 family protein [Myxococcota bacterium]|nr:Yip1 family protein [Myxococcota bacterium]
MNDKNPSFIGCINHNSVSARAVCVRCGSPLCGECVSRDDAGLVVCVVCPQERPATPDAAFRGQQPTQRPGFKAAKDEKPQVQDDGEGSFIPWEDTRIRKGLLSFGLTVYFSLRSPNRYLKGINYERKDIATPLIFALIAGCLGQLAMWSQLIADPELLRQAMMATPQGQAQAQNIDPQGFLLQLLPIIPIAVSAFLFVKAWIGHSMIRLLGGDSRPFAATFRVFAYTEAMAILMWIPHIGTSVYRFMTIFMLLTGIRAAHRVSLTTSMLALMPIILMPVLFSLPTGA